MLDKIRTKLIPHIDIRIVEEILDHYQVLKAASQVQDWEKCILRGGKFAEAVMKAIRFVRTGEAVDRISIDPETNAVAQRTDLPAAIRLFIPRAVRVIYDHRSQRGGAHSFSFDPNPMDAALVSSVADWILGEFVRLYWTDDPQKAMKIVTALISKGVPFVERIDDDYILLRPGTSARQEISLILYSCYPQRTNPAQLIKWMPYHSPQNIRTSLNNMQKAKELHRDKGGVLLTQLGIRVAEQKMAAKSCH